MDAVAAIIAGGTLFWYAGKSLADVVIQISKSTPNSTEESQEQSVAATTTLPDDTVIYRYGGTNPGNLTPRQKDMHSGLSFSTIPRPGAACTTIGAVNATGVLMAVQDGPTHVTVRPIGGTVKDWIKGGANSIWTKTLKSVCCRM